MIDSLLKQLANETSEELTQKAGIPKDLISNVFKETSQVATQEVASQAAKNGIGNLMNLFSNKPNNGIANSIESSLTSSLINNFSEKIGLTKQQATMASSIIVPMLLKLITKENEKTPETDPSPIQQIFELGGNTKGAKSALGGLLGKFLKG